MADLLEFPSIPLGATVLAQMNCTLCKGGGVRLSPVEGVSRVCRCVWRSVFRHCHHHYTRQTLSPWMRCRKHRWDYPQIEFRVDFVLLARRVLDALHYAIFEKHLLGGMHWRECAAKVGLDKGQFFHSIYRIQSKLGEAYHSNGLYPLREYHDRRNHARPRAVAMMPAQRTTTSSTFGLAAAAA